jgi:predicted phosphoribosyltransferase
MVLGLPRGGVPVAYEVATALGAPLDVFLVRKLGVPGREELAMGAIASGGVVVINDDVVRGLGISPEVIQQVAEQEGRELVRREDAYREDRPFPEVAGKTVIVVDDGLATGSSMRAAIEALRRLAPARIVVAVPAAPKSTCQELAALAGEVVCATTPSPFFAVGNSYWDFTQTTDAEVRDLLRAAPGSRSAGGTAPGPTQVAVIRAEAVPVEEGTPADHVLFERSSSTWTGSTRRPRPAPGSGTPVSTSSAVTTPRSTGSPRLSGRASSASRRSSSSSSTCSDTP